jgi:hypothetical protein
MAGWRQNHALPKAVKGNLGHGLTLNSGLGGLPKVSLHFRESVYFYFRPALRGSGLDSRLRYFGMEQIFHH